MSVAAAIKPQGDADDPCQVFAGNGLPAVRTRLPVGFRTAHVDYSPINHFTATDGYSPIARLERSMMESGTVFESPRSAACPAHSRSASPPPDESNASQLPDMCSMDVMRRLDTVPANFCSPDRPSIRVHNPFSDIPQQILALRQRHDSCEDESPGDPIDDLKHHFRLRYNDVSMEEMYSPIAGMAQSHNPFASGRSPKPRLQMWSHEDADGAVCSHPVHSSITLRVQTADSTMNIVVKEGMCVLNVKEKLWQLSGISPTRQQLRLMNGAVLPDNLNMKMVDWQPDSVLLLETL